MAVEHSRLFETSSFEVHLAPTGRELVQALRGLLMQAHWHTFTVLADQVSATALRRPELWDALAAAPLHPSLVSLPSPLRPQNLFRKLADISRSTRGVVTLMSDRSSAIRILDDAKRLNMMDGHFVWLWIDTAATINLKNVTDDERDLRDKPEERVRRSSSLGQSDISDMHINYLLKNDQFLLFSRTHGVESSKLKDQDRRSQHRPRAGGSGESSGELPAGLLSLKPLSVKVDRHLVKGAVRLLVAALKLVIGRSPEWMLNNFVNGHLTNNCWKNVAIKENSFISEFARPNQDEHQGRFRGSNNWSASTESSPRTTEASQRFLAKAKEVYSKGTKYSVGIFHIVGLYHIT
ncbi:uncharacterized protein LOC111692060 [Anoplophora glabripennis]|uniref:uncharacterized protein LOC111692060 n=1 Tax=Anoplophora glabripennis TaxID=217634 RepID=UPI000C775370|nr:uncharacterized protein LOC111692060 [Anoplophora glabripennis]